jgi:hypothetical protein
MRLDSSGRLGLGSSAPSERFDLQLANGAGNLGIRLVHVGQVEYKIGINDSDDKLYITNNNGDAAIGSTTKGLVITPTGAVGIGTTAPSSLLHVEGGTTYINSTNAGGTSTPLQLSNAGSSGTSIVKLAFNNAGITKASINAAVFGNDYLAFNTGSDTERARIDSSGRLLVGTSTSASTGNGYTPGLQVAAQSGSISASSYRSDEYGGIIALQKSKSATVGTQTIVSNNDQLGLLSFEGSDGTNFEVAAQIQAYVDGTPGANDMPGRLVFSTTADGASSPTERMRITQAGYVQIGAKTNTDNAPLLVDQDAGANNVGIGTTTTSTGTRYHLMFRNGNGQVGSISTNGSATTYATSSDYRLKENVIPLTGAANRLNQLQVHRFNFIADPEKTVDGFLAHEAQAVVPECVTGTKDEVDADGNPVYQGIDQSKLVPLLTAALQEAIGRIETLEARLDAANL